MLMSHHDAPVPMFLFGQERRLWLLCLHKPHVTEILSYLTSILLCKWVDLGCSLDTSFIDSIGTITRQHMVATHTHCVWG